MSQKLKPDLKKVTMVHEQRVNGLMVGCSACTWKLWIPVSHPSTTRQDIVKQATTSWEPHRQRSHDGHSQRSA